MSTTTWTVKNQTKGITYSNILSLNFSNGRQTFIDDYSGNNASITILNNDESTLSVDLGDQIRVYPTVNGETNGTIVFWVTSFLFNDEPGSMGNSSVTILAEDSIARLGRRVVSVTTTAGNLCLTQLKSMVETYGNPINFCNVQSSSEMSFASSQTWNGSIADFLRQQMRTEQGWISSSPVTYNQSTALGGTIFVNGRRAGRQQFYEYGRNASLSVIGYQDIQRNKFFDIFANDVTVSPVGLASQQTTNPASVAAYGNYSVSQTSSDQTTTQAAGLSQYLSTVLSDLNLLNIVISFSDKAQVDASNFYKNFAINLHIASGYKSTLYYRQPGDTVDRSIQVTMTGFSVSVTPSETIWTVYFAPMSVYNYFKLNSDTQGILDESRLGW
jgi:hypothetical protein